MALSRIGKAIMLLLAGGALLQTTTSCQDTIVPLATNLLTSVVLQSLLGGLAT